MPDRAVVQRIDEEPCEGWDVQLRALVAISEDRQLICVLRDFAFWLGMWSEESEGYERVPVDLYLDLGQDANDVLAQYIAEAGDDGA